MHSNREHEPKPLDNELKLQAQADEEDVGEDDERQRKDEDDGCVVSTAISMSPRDVNVRVDVNELCTIVKKES